MTEAALPNNALINFTDTEVIRLPVSIYKEAKSYLSYRDIKKIQKAYTFAFYAHQGQKRKDGTDYITHPVAVTQIMLGLKVGPDSICAALMHDVLGRLQRSKK